MSTLLKKLGKEIGLGKRLLFALTALFAPSVLLLSVAKAFLKLVDELNEEELKTLIMEIQDV